MSGPQDVCIVGAGAAGILLAVELARQGKRVLLLEAGGRNIEESSQEPYRSVVAGQPHNGVHVGRFRVHGGTTTRWGGQILELDDLDFEERSWVPGSGWPIGKQELTPYYQRAIDLEGLGQSNLEDAGIWRRLGLSSPEFQGFETFFTRWCPEANFARLHAEKLTGDHGITTCLHANVVGMVCDGSRIRAVRAKTLNGLDHLFFADQFVWCMGGIESSRLFLQPEYAAMPWQTNGLLGRHFQDHIVVAAAELKLRDARRFHRIFDNVFLGGLKYQPKIRLDRAMQERHRTLNTGAMIMAVGETGEVEAELKSTAKKLLRGKLGEVRGSEAVRLLRHAPLLARQAWRYGVAHRAYMPPAATYQLGVHCEQLPQGASSITLAKTRDQLGLLRTRIDWQVADEEIASIRTFVQVAAESLLGLADVIPDPDLASAPDRFRAKCGDGYHHMGGMRMSSTPEAGIVDLNLKLHGMDNGYVCSGAVFPTSGFSNPTHTVLALAVRLADHLSHL